jgi:hypothetical protein
LQRVGQLREATRGLALMCSFLPSTPTPQGSIKKEFPQNLGGSDMCYFCQKRVYVMERLSAEGKFFHRSCFKCEYCATTLRLSAYAYDIEDGESVCT